MARKMNTVLDYWELEEEGWNEGESGMHDERQAMVEKL